MSQVSARSHQLTIHQVDPARSGEHIVAVLARNLPTAADARRIDWLYRGNPDGPALVWLAMNDDGRPVGISVAHPRRMRVHDTIVRALNLGDFALDLPYRSLGPGLQLLRATLEPVRRGEYAFSYDFASRPMQAIYRRLGAIDIGGMDYRVRRAASPWRVWRRLGAGAGGGGAPGGTRHDVEVDPLAGAPGEEFNALDTRLAHLRPVLGVRDSAYLSWRYVRHTMWRHDILCARRHGVLAGYAVVRRGDAGRVRLMDLHADPENGIRERLAAAAVDWARAHGARAVAVEVLARSAAAQMATAAGFQRRGEGVGPILFVPLGGPYATTLNAPDSWWLTGGDRDV